MLPKVKPGIGDIMQLALGTDAKPTLHTWMNTVSAKMKKDNPHLHECFFNYVKGIVDTDYKVSVIDLCIAGMVIYDMLDRQSEVDELNEQWKG